MPREKNPERGKAETLLRKGMKPAEIAKRLGIPAGSVRRWKAELGKDKEKSAKARPGKERKTEKSAHEANARRSGGQPGNVNAVGNNGGPPLRNKNAQIHGIYAKYLPEETMEIMDTLAEVSPLDALWKQILTQQAVIIRSQKIFEMHRGEKTEEVVSEGGKGTEYMVQEPWDKESQYLTAFSRAQSTLQSMLRTYMEMEGRSRQEAASGAKDWKAAILEISRRRSQGQDQEAQDQEAQDQEAQDQEGGGDGQ